MSQIFLGSQPKGASVELTLDPVIQKLAYDLIPDGQRGSIVVTNPKTGAIIAMVSKPSYNPNLIATHDPAKEKAGYDQINQVPGINLNQSVSGPTGELLAPGSVFKLVDTAAALQFREVQQGQCLAEPGQPALARFDASLPNYAGGNCSTRTQPISLSPWNSRATRRSRASRWTWARTPSPTRPASSASDSDFGDQLKLQSAVSVFPKNLDQAALAQSAVGQRDVRATPLQIAIMTAAIANKGVQMKPNLIKTVRAPDLRVISEPKAEALRTSTTPDIASQITSG